MFAVGHDRRADPAEVSAALRAVVDGVAEAPDTTADPLHLAYLRGASDALRMVAEGERPESNESGHDSRDAGDGSSAQDGESR